MTFFFKRSKLLVQNLLPQTFYSEKKNFKKKVAFEENSTALTLWSKVSPSTIILVHCQFFNQTISKPTVTAFQTLLINTSLTLGTISMSTWITWINLRLSNHYLKKNKNQIVFYSTVAAKYALFLARPHKSLHNFYEVKSFLIVIEQNIKQKPADRS